MDSVGDQLGVNFGRSEHRTDYARIAVRKRTHRVVGVCGVMRAVRDSGSRLLVGGVGMANGDNHAEAARRIDTGHRAEKLGSNRENASITAGRL